MTPTVGTEQASVARHVVLDAIFNFRDLGGYLTPNGARVRPRAVYRADGIHRLSGDDVTKVSSLGLRTVVDLRTPSELEERGRFPVARISVSYHHLPILEHVWGHDEFLDDLPAAEFLSARYEEMLAAGATSIASVVGLLADPANLPLVFHCAAGKDRTGVTAAIVLSLLGVDDADIASDYALSHLGMDRMREWFAANMPDGRDTMAQPPEAFFQAPKEAILMLLDRVRAANGSVDSYVERIGVTSDQVAAVRSNLLEVPVGKQLVKSG